MAKIDARDNDCVGRSPCIGCERENEDKRKCASTCELLAAYRGGMLSEEKEDMMNDEHRTSNVQHRTSNEKEIKTKDQKPEKVQKKCACGCGKDAKIRGLSRACYQAWTRGRIEPDGYGKFVAVQQHRKKEGKKVRKLEDKKPKAIPEIEGPRLDAVAVIDLKNYPKINSQVNYLSGKYFVTLEHVIIGLLGEALAARKERLEGERVED